MNRSSTSADVAANALADLGVELDSDVAGPKPARTLHVRRAPLASPSSQLGELALLELEDTDGAPADFGRTLGRHGHAALTPAALEIFQVNLGKLCNMTCRHCHVDAGPDRIDAMMDDDTFEAMIGAMGRSGAHTVDITGGAPELHPRFRDLVLEARALGKHVIDRCNLTILALPKFEQLPRWLAEQGVEIVASLPHYRRLSTDAQRGDGTFERSIEVICRLNEVGYGKGDPGRVLTLMSNPAGAFLGGNQATMESEWRADLERNYGATFDRLLVLNNMPISRFLEWLVATDNLPGYMQRLVDRFNPDSVPGLMCRNTISVSWDGRVYDCDFNQMLDLESCTAAGTSLRISEFTPERYADRRIVTARHCYGCTAGCGSSCGGKTA